MGIRHSFLNLVQQALFSQGVRGLPRRLRVSLRYLHLLVRYLMYRLSFGGLCRSAPHQLATVRLRQLVPDSCGMISPDERAYFYGYARRLFTGRGDIVDLGCWLGATTISLAGGLAANQRPRAVPRTIHAYDRFIWEEWMDRVQLLGDPPLTRTYRPQESFLDEFHKRIAPWKQRVTVHAEDLVRLGWHGGPIEFLLVDAMKSWELTNSIIRGFFPWLIPGQSVIVHQDFVFWGEPWVHLINYRLRDYFEPLYHIPHSGSMAFGLRKPIPAELLTAAYSFASFSPDDIDAAIAYSAGLVSADLRPDVLAVKAYIHLVQGDLARARGLLEEYRSQGIPFTSGLITVEQLVAEKQPR